jgi:predicted nucleic acid-binding protein
VTDAILDTSVVVDLLRSFPPATEWLAKLGRQRVGLTPVVWMETVQGATDKGKRAQAIRFMSRFRIEHPTEDANRWAMRQLASFHLSHGVQLQDTMIASVASSLGIPLYTTNLKHFLALPSVDARKPY